MRSGLLRVSNPEMFVNILLGTVKGKMTPMIGEYPIIYGRYKYVAGYNSLDKIGNYHNRFSFLQIEQKDDSNQNLPRLTKRNDSSREFVFQSKHDAIDDKVSCPFQNFNWFIPSAESNANSMRVNVEQTFLL